MLQIKRQKEIFDIIAENKNVTVKEICARVYASPATVRRDLCVLENEGLITRSFGGASLNELFPKQVPSTVRENEGAAEKRKLSAKAAGMIGAGETIFVDGSTTTFYLAQYLKAIPDITVITNNPKLSLALAEFKVRSFCTGGEMLNESMIFVGTEAERYVRGIRAHKFIFSARGISENGATDSCVYQCNIKRAMMERADKSIFVGGAAKCGHTYPYVIAEREEIDYIITEI